MAIPPMPKCTVCEVTKSKRLPQPGHDSVSTFAGQLTLSDTWGPFRSALYYKGCRYIVVFVDDYSKVKLAVFCKDRTTSTLLEGYKLWHAFMSTLGCPPNGTWQSDGGPEYVSNEAFEFCDEHAIQRLLSVRYVPTGNGVAESVFRVHIPRARAACRGAGLVPEAYALAFQHSLWLSNRSWSKQLGGRPFDRVPNPPPHSEVHRSAPFGCRMWAHQPAVNVADKMADTARAGVFVGMSELYKGVICYYPQTHTFEPCIHVKYDKWSMPLKDAVPPERPEALPVPSPLPPLYVPTDEPVLAPAIPAVPPPALDLHLPVRQTPARQPVRSVLPTVHRSIDDDDDDGATVPALAPPAPMLPMLPLVPPAPPPPAPLPPLVPPAPPPPAPLPPAAPPASQHQWGAIDTPRRAGSRTTARDRQDDMARAVATPVPGSLAVVVAWLAATWHPPYVLPVAAMRVAAPGADVSAHTAVVIFSGVDSALPAALRARGARVVEVDISIAGRFHDLTDVTPDAIGWHLRRAAQRGEIHSLHAAVPCETFSVALDDGDMVRSAVQPMGLDRLSWAKHSKLFLSNALLHFTVDLATDVHRAGGQVTVENPSPRMDLGLPHVYWAAKAHHANLFRTPAMVAYRNATGSTEITLPLCACGLDMQKYVTVLATPGAALVLAPLDGLVCTHSSHAEHAYGYTSSGLRAGLQSASYPYVFCVVLACSHLGLSPPGVSSVGGSPRVVPAATARVVLPTAGALGVSVPAAFSSRVQPARRSSLPALRVRAPAYRTPVGPGWWGDADEGDLSDEGDDVFSLVADRGSASAVGGGADWPDAVEYQACVKVVDACKAATRTRFSTGPDGGSLRHDIPRGYDEAARHAEAPAIWEAMIREMNAHADCGTWTVRPAAECYSSGKQPIDCMWVYDCKVNATTSEFLLWKARLVARGDQMVYLRDYLDTYSGVVRHSTFRIFLALCAALALVLTGADVSTAYLHAPLRDFVVWMRLPRGFPADFNGSPALCRLNMALYGLKQSAREWAITLISWLTTECKYKFVQCCSDRYMFRCDCALGVLVLLIWVDDIFMGHSSDELRSLFMGDFTQRFRVKDLGCLQQALGASIAQSVPDGWVTLSLSKYISDLSRRFDLHVNVAWADIPVPAALARECRDASPTEAEVRATVDVFSVLTGSIVFVATFSRPDVAYAAHLLSTYMARPGPVHMKLARRVLGYLSRTRDLVLTYRRGGGDVSMSFTPLDTGVPDATGLPHMLVDTNHDVERSISGWLVMYSGAAVVWAVRGQVMPSLSSAESELYGLSTGVCDLLSASQVLEELGQSFPAVTVATDSRGARLLAMDCAAAARTRHIHRRWYFVRYHIDEGHVRVVLLKGTLNHSNFLTKPVGGAAFSSDRAYVLGIPVA